jgi:probable HAF family extracellular repeat protein
VNRLNDLGQVVGYSSTSNRNQTCWSERAFVYDSHTEDFTPLDGGPPSLHKPLCGSNTYATGINNFGQVVGYANRGINGDNVGFLWSRDAGFVALPQAPDMRDVRPRDINIHGQVIGTYLNASHSLGRPPSYFYWDQATGMVDLQTLLDPSDPTTADVQLWHNGWDIRINDQGNIMVSGKRRSAPPPKLEPANRIFVLMRQQ